VLRLDPATYLGVIALLAGVAMMAFGAPAWRAARVDPASTPRIPAIPLPSLEGDFMPEAGTTVGDARS
jgi:hypothetical protein